MTVNHYTNNPKRPMSRLLSVTIPVVVLACQAIGIPAALCTPQFAPLSTATYSGDSQLPFWREEEAGRWGGAGWVGWRNDGDRLERVQFDVRPRPKSDANDEDEVTVVTTPEVNFAVRCVPEITPGPILNARIQEHDLAYHGPLHIALGTRKYQLQLDGKDPSLADARVILRDGRRSQVLYSADGFVDEPHFQIVWAGDLDRDGKLDLVVNIHRKYSWHPYRLLLSSKAVGKSLVGEAALFETGD